MDILFLILIILSAIILVLLIMIQDEHGEGLGGIFGGGSSTPFGSRSGNVLAKITTIVAIVFIICTLALAYLKRTPRESGEVLDYVRGKKYQEGTDKLWYVTTDTEDQSTTGDTATGGDETKDETGKATDSESGTKLIEGGSKTDTSAEDKNK